MSETSRPINPDLAERKLELEVKKLEQDTSPLQTEIQRSSLKKLVSDTNGLGTFSNKIWPILATIITLFLSGFAAILSVHTQGRQNDIEISQKRKEALADAVKLATDNSGEADRRVAGIWELKQFWNRPDDFELIASVLSAELTLPDKDRFARCAAAEVIGSAMESGADYRPQLAKLLYGYKDGTIGLVVRQQSLLADVGAEKRASNECISALDATREAIRKNWRYLRDVNLNSTDLSKIQLYSADLSGALFIDSKVSKSNFRCANLYSADFSGVEWAEADFRYANVAYAKPDSFKEFAKKNGALEMDDAAWQSWSKGGFKTAENDKPADCLNAPGY